MEWLPALSQSLYHGFPSFLLLWTPQLPSEQCSPEERMQVKLLLDTNSPCYVHLVQHPLRRHSPCLICTEHFSISRLNYLPFFPAVAQVWHVLKDTHSLLEALEKAFFVSFVCLFHKAMGSTWSFDCHDFKLVSFFIKLRGWPVL